MSVPVHRAPRAHGSRRWRAALAGLSVAALALVSIPAFADDSIFFDGDYATTPGAPNISYGDGGKACADRGTPVNGAFTVKYNGNQDGPTHHFTPGETISVNFVTPAGVTLTLTDPTPTVPLDWNDQQDEFNILFTTTVSPTSAGGKVEGTLTGNSSGYDAGAGAGNGKTNFQVQINCAVVTPPSNTAPSVAITSSATTSDEGSKTSAITFAITDPDANSWTFATGYPICGTDGTASDKAIDNRTKTGSFKCTFPDGPATRTVAVKVNDGTADSNEATIGATVNNVVPVVAQPAFAATAVDCRSLATLGGLAFSDAGLVDSPWQIDIDWKDGSHDTFSAASQTTAITDRTHTYTASGTYTPTITVTDKDGGVGTATSSTTLTVNRVFQTDFLPPFDDSTPSKLITNTMKNGRTVPVKATIFDTCSNGGYVTAPAAVTVGVKKSTTSTSATPDPVETYSDAGASSGNTEAFRWNADATSPTGGFWIYNLDSKGLGLTTNTVYRIDIYVDGSQATKTDWALLQPVK